MQTELRQSGWRVSECGRKTSEPADRLTIATTRERPFCSNLSGVGTSGIQITRILDGVANNRV